MDTTSDTPTGCARVIVKMVVALSLPFVLSPRELATEAASNVAEVFITCFSRLRQRRPHFNEEHKEALLKEDERFSDAAMIELRRRMMEGGTSTIPTIPLRLVATDQPARPSRWKERKIQERARAHCSSSPNWKRTSSERAFTLLASDTERALDQILKSTKMTRKRSKSTEPMDAKSEGRQNMEKTGEESVLLDLHDLDSCDGGVLGEWLAGIDESRSEEYRIYAKQLKEHGFMTLEDLAQLESEDDVDQAMSEVGITKFAHRLRIRKAIQQLHFQASEQHKLAVAAIPVAASA
ncbi:Sterile alpha motif, type 1 [Plasmopara halstedii]|uniref:Sterile alpha motif, type 1 n=1 Tax=Plasmopara halstedii TaxID=4781 RepID=A0A0P1B178_PLAHL|nr:Sterile alpha motif, type 1 [Plasmopara halstedii]CEG47918.1 Sterile alpha motif, type 1 [Plasmopara halstedii]|eukprot:XP_024584287.1 Sterile alpha motif, type 1 [Plasmopara halstedii]